MTPYRYKKQQNSWIWSSRGQISPPYDAAFRRSLETEKINKHSNIVYDYHIMCEMFILV